MTKYIGLDIGGTTIKAGLVNKSGKILKTSQFDTQSFRGEDVVFENIIHALEEVMDKDVVGIGIGCPGPLDLNKGLVIETPNLPFKNFQIVSKISKAMKIKNVVLENDANCFTLGEAIYGKGVGSNHVFGIILGTGFGSSLVINQVPYHGATGFAPEVGHMSINYDNDKDTFINQGCVENYMSKESLIKFANIFGLNIKSTKELNEHIKKRSRNIKSVMDMYGKFLGITLANIVYAYDPEVIILGGGISNLYPNFKDAALAEMGARLNVKHPKIVKSSLQEKASILGAASLVFNEGKTNPSTSSKKVDSSSKSSKETKKTNRVKSKKTVKRIDSKSKPKKSTKSKK